MNAKTLKISPPAHQELKIFIAQHPEENMSEFSEAAILKEMKARGHKFIVYKEKKSSK